MKTVTYKEARACVEDFVARQRATANLKALEEYSNVPWEVLFAEALEDVARLNAYDLQEEYEAWKND